jgi:hypothetical protein
MKTEPEFGPAYLYTLVHVVTYRLRQYATSQKVAGSRIDVIIKLY